MSSPTNWDVLAPRQASNPWFSFDNFGDSLFILFQIVSQEGWVEVMWSGQSATGVFTQPEPFHNQFNAVFFVIFNLLGAVFVLTLFVSVFMRNYTEQTGVAFLTTDQRSWLELRKLLRQVSPSKRPHSNQKRQSWEQWCYLRAVRKTGRWQRFVTCVLMFHLVLLCLEFYPEPHWWEVTRGKRVVDFYDDLGLINNDGSRCDLFRPHHFLRLQHRRPNNWAYMVAISKKLVGPILSPIGPRHLCDNHYAFRQHVIANILPNQ